MYVPPQHKVSYKVTVSSYTQFVAVDKSIG